MMICNPVSNSENVTLRYLLYKIWTENVSLWRHENWNPPFSKWLDPRLCPLPLLFTTNSKWQQVLLLEIEEAKTFYTMGLNTRKNRVRTHAIYWRCWRKECRANLQTNVFDLDDRNPNIQILQESPHTHEEILIDGHQSKQKIITERIEEKIVCVSLHISGIFCIYFFLNNLKPINASGTVVLQTNFFFLKK